MSLNEVEVTRTQPSRTGATQAWLRALEITASIAKNPKRTLPVVVQENAERFGAAPALLSDQECWSHQQLAERMNQYARWALTHGIGSGEVVALLMPNRPEYLAIWLGLTAVGAVVSLINVNLRDRSLAHCINIVAPKAIIVAAELGSAFEPALAGIDGAPIVRSHGAGFERFLRIDLEVDQCSGAMLAPSERREVNIEDRALYMYTSGT